jgi:hypothetical protein
MTETANAPTLLGLDGKPIYADESPFAAAYIAHWPNGPVAACEAHTRKLQAIGTVMGIHVAITTPPTGSKCANCINESNPRSTS